MPPGTSLILDHFPEGPWVVTYERAELRRELKHAFGEGEMMAIYWAGYFDTLGCLVDTIDTDFMPLAVHYLVASEPAREKPLLWRYDAKEYVQTLTDDIYSYWGWTDLDFMVSLSLSRFVSQVVLLRRWLSCCAARTTLTRSACWPSWAVP